MGEKSKEKGNGGRAGIRVGMTPPQSHPDRLPWIFIEVSEVEELAQLRQDGSFRIVSDVAHKTDSKDVLLEECGNSMTTFEDDFVNKFPLKPLKPAKPEPESSTWRFVKVAVCVNLIVLLAYYLTVAFIHVCLENSHHHFTDTASCVDRFKSEDVRVGFEAISCPAQTCVAHEFLLAIQPWVRWFAIICDGLLFMIGCLYSRRESVLSPYLDDNNDNNNLGHANATEVTYTPDDETSAGPTLLSRCTLSSSGDSKAWRASSRDCLMVETGR